MALRGSMRQLGQQSSGSFFGQFCYIESGNCVYLLTNDTNCEEGSTFPVLVNSDLGSKSAEVKMPPDGRGWANEIYVCGFRRNRRLGHRRESHWLCLSTSKRSNLKSADLIWLAPIKR